MTNTTVLQFFHWYYPKERGLWNHAGEEAARIADLGITHVWLPPAYKSADGENEPGYATYDLFDLGEFDQKGSVRTKYGTKDEYVGCIAKLHEAGIDVLADVVLNHKQGGDEEELFQAQLVDEENRNEPLGEPEDIKAYTKFYFPGRQQKYSDFIWDFRSFTGVSLDGGQKVYKVLNEYGVGWDELTHDEKGNFDYFMGCDIEFRNPHVMDELKWWGKWYLETTKVDGFRLDALKHISPRFINEWLGFLKHEFQRDYFTVGEFWSHDRDMLKVYHDACNGQVDLFDVPLHYNFARAAGEGEAFDLTKIYDGSLVQEVPFKTVTFVENHDTQPLQGLESPVADWFKPHAYALILLREQGAPCVFYPDLYGTEYEDYKDGEKYSIRLAPVDVLPQLLKARRHLAFGAQHEYFDHPNCVGWTREGIGENALSGVAVLLSNGGDHEKTMFVGEAHRNTRFVCIAGEREEVVTIAEDGNGHFPVSGGRPSVWVREEARARYF